MRKHIQLLAHYFTQYAKVRLAYRADFFIGVATSMLATLFAFGFVVVLFAKIPKLAGWSFEEVMFLYGFSLVPYGLFNIVSLNLYDFGSTHIIEGKFDRVLLRPVSSLYQVLFENIRIESLQEVLTGLLLIFLAARRMERAWSAADALLLAGFALCGVIIYLAVFLVLTSVAFWMEDRIGVHAPVWNLIAFGRYPLNVYNAAVQFFLSWIIPFGFASFYPSARLLGRAEFRNYAWGVPLVAVAFFGMALAMWNAGVKRYSSTGS